ncbi:MAG: hypothetical protein AB1467_00110 [Candidatus Diapherotrites archaeon]
MKKIMIAIAFILLFSVMVKADVAGPEAYLPLIALIIAFLLIIGLVLYFILKKSKQAKKIKAVK